MGRNTAPPYNGNVAQGCQKIVKSCFRALTRPCQSEHAADIREDFVPAKESGRGFRVRPVGCRARQTFLLEGADGNLWFSNIVRHEIARFDIGRRQLRTFRLHPTSQVLAMSNRPDRPI
jgi:hypothetical protein